MYPLKLTNLQIKDILLDITNQLKTTCLTNNSVAINYKVEKKTNTRRANLRLTATAYNKIEALVNKATTEISWHGLCRKEDNDVYTIYDIIVYPQTVTGATVTTDQAKYQNWLMEQPDEVFDNIRFQGHSHVNMSTSPSITDITYFQNMLNNIGCNDYYIFAIFNKKNEYHALIYDKQKNVCFEHKDIDLDILLDDGTTAKDFAQNAMKEYIKEPPVYKYTSGYNLTHTNPCLASDEPRFFGIDDPFYVSDTVTEANTYPKNKKSTTKNSTTKNPKKKGKK